MSSTPTLPAQSPMPVTLSPSTTPARWAGAMASLLGPLLDRQKAMLVVKDLETGRIVHANEAMAEFHRRPLADLLGCTDGDLFPGTLSTALRAADQTALAQGAPLSSIHRFEWNGTPREFTVLRSVGEPDEQGRRCLCLAWFDLAVDRQRDTQLRSALAQLEELQRALEQLRRETAEQGLRDKASGLYSRAHFEDQLRREVDLSTREHREFALVFIQIDPPREKVRELGEPARERIFEAMGRLLRGNTRAMDAACRSGEDRFAVLLSGVGLATAHSRMEGLRRQCATQIVVLDGQELGFTVAMGVASFPHTAHNQDELLEACESALSEARRRGGNHVTLASIRFETARRTPPAP